MGGRGPGTIALEERSRQKRAEKVASMEAMYRDGLTLQQIGDRFNISRERVRQLLKKDTALTAETGGISIRKERIRTQKQQRRDAASLEKWGCTYSQYRELLKIGREMRAAGCGPAQTPTAAYKTQKNNSKHRKIAWELSLWDWWQIWQRSGKWKQRGRGQGYVMSRVGDVGAYALGNVWITTSAENSSSSPKVKKSSLPMGVHFIKNGNYKTYRAVRMMGGKVYYIGCFKTPELAHAAYLSFVPPEAVAA